MKIQKYRPSSKEINNDRIMTPLDYCIKIVNHFKPAGSILDPCCGTGNFLRAFKKYGLKKIFWCEIDKNRDFFNFDKKVDWIITNPPFSNVTKFLEQSFKIANNVCFISTAYHPWTTCRRKIREKYNMGIKEIYIIDYPNNFPKAGFDLCVIHFQKNYSGDIKLTKM